MQRSSLSISQRITLLVVAVLLVTLTACVRATGAPAPDRANQAWTDRLNGQAQAAELAREEEVRRQRAYEAYSLRLTAQARAQEAKHSRERANQAWTDRLNGLAEHLSADR